jgi:molecular chaperone DnaJ
MFMLSTTCPQCRGEGQLVTRPCKECEGQGRSRQERKLSVDVPAGVDHGVTMRLRGKGAPGERGGPPGDLHLVIHVKPHPDFVRKGYDVHSELAISFVHAALGHKTTVATVLGEQEIEILRGSQPGQTVLLKGKGIPKLPQDGAGAGNHVVHLTVEIPEELTAAQEKLLGELGKELELEVHPVKKKAKKSGIRSFFDKLREDLG